MKYILAIVVLILVLAGGYVYFSKSTPTPINGVVTNVNLDQVTFDGPALITISDEVNTQYTVAVPSMGIRLCEAADSITSPWDISPGDLATVYGAENEEGYIVPCESKDHYLRVTGTYADTEAGYFFTYPKGPTAYTVVPYTENTDANLISEVHVFNKTEYEVLKDSTDAREGPGFLAVAVYENTNKEFPGVWAMNHPQQTNYNLMVGEPQETVIGGANAETFTIDGLYPSTVHVVAHDSKIYVLTSMVPDGMSDMEETFDTLITSFGFRPAN